MARIKRQDNAIGLKGVVGAIAYDVEFDALEQLGPLTRRAISEAPMKIHAKPILDQLIAAGVSPKIPGLDASIARGIQIEAYKNLRIDRPHEDAQAGIIPLKPREGSRRRRW